MSTTIDPAAKTKHLFERAVRHHVAGRLDEAAQLYRETIAMAPDFAEACNNLSAILGERGETARALALAERAARIKPDYGEAHHNVGLLLTLGPSSGRLSLVRRGLPVRSESRRLGQ
ncbi:MAG: tetratricopeptide repeat protein [Gemmatimonadaceae bacterium]